MRLGLRGLTIVFLGAFLVATVGTGVATYALTLHTIDRVVDRRLDNVSDLVGGTDGRATVTTMLDRIDRFAQRRDTGDIGFVLSDAAGRRLGGNVPLPRPIVPGFSRVDTSDRIIGLSAGRAYSRRIGPGLFLTTIAETEPFDGYDRDRVGIYLIGFGSIVVIVLAGLLAFVATVTRRFAATRRTVDAIIAGDIGQRIPVSGSADEFDRQAIAFNRMLDRIAELMDGLRNVSNDVAHDLRMPLARLRSRLATIAAAADGAAQRAAMEGAIEQCDHILAMFGAMLRIAEIEAGRRVAGFAPVDLASLLADAVETLAPVAADSGHDLRLAAVPPLRITGDARLVEQALINLVENALRHTPPGTAITVGGAVAADHAVVTVRDRGPGIPADQRSLALRRFGRLETSRNRPGHGLGLPLVRAISRLHGGDVTLENGDPGLLVRMIFPRA